jgi:hypothetical protein
MSIQPISVVAGEQQVFKCTKADGSVIFSPQPCGANAKEQHVGVTPRAGSADANAPIENDAVRDISNSVADSRCRDDAHKLYVEPDTSALARAQSELKQVEGRRWVGGSAANRQMAALNDETHAASLRSLIATEGARIDAARAESRKRVDEALRTCDEQKQQREVH